MIQIKNFSEIKGQENLKRVIEISLCGSHNLLILGAVCYEQDVIMGFLKDLVSSNTIPNLIHFDKPCRCGHRLSPNIKCICSLEDKREY